MKIDLRVNGVEHVSEVEPRTLLVHYLRETLNLTGTHIGCETTLCGACTVLMDGAAVKSCTVLAVQADGTEITTIEGLSQGDRLHAVQEGFWEEHGLQCGFCTPGMIMAGAQFLQRIRIPQWTRFVTELKETSAGARGTSTSYRQSSTRRSSAKWAR